MNAKAQQYKEMFIKTAPVEKILIMLYEAAIQNVKKASVCIDKHDIVGKSKYIIKTHDIINELSSSLNFEIGGKIARDLERLYNFIIEQLLKANVENSKEALTNVCNILANLLGAWQQAVMHLEKGKNNGT
ncbi:MAG: flagellar export chaperone FliS [Bdellovibrio sp.]|nr:flagellar export chaperone FliS [Bdellovibrio sp.]